MNTHSYKVLMCPPQFYDVVYEINPWMKVGSVSHDLAEKQWDKLVQIYQDLGIDVITLDPLVDHPDMVFTTDHGISLEDNFLLSNFKYQEREGEEKVTEGWLSSHHYSVKTINEEYKFEGGDCVRFGDILFVGYGFRTDKSATNEIQKYTNLKVIPIELINKRFYHLDTALFALDDEHLFYVRSAFSEESLHILTYFDNLIEIARIEANNFGANAVRIDNTVLLTPQNPQMKADIIKIGYEALEIDVSEFLKSGGGVHCLTQCLN